MADDKPNDASLSKREPRRGPDWDEWMRNRPVCRLWEGLHLAHNIPTNREAAERLQDKNDPRVAKFRNRLNTAIRGIRAQHPLLHFLGSLPEDTEGVEKIYLSLPKFVLWVKEQSWDGIPDRFWDLPNAYKNMQPPTPDWATWSKIPSLTLKEAASLYLNVDPDIHKNPQARLLHCDFYDEYDRIKKVFVRNVKNDKILYSQYSSENTEGHRILSLESHKILELITRIGWDIPEDFQKTLSNAAALSSQNSAVHQNSTNPAEMTGNDLGPLKKKNLETTIGALLVMLIDIARHLKEGKDFNTKNLFIGEGKLNQQALAERLVEEYYGDLGLDLSDKGTITERFRHGLKAYPENSMAHAIISGKGWQDRETRQNEKSRREKLVPARENR